MLLFARWCGKDSLFFLPPYDVARIRTHVSRVAMNQGDLWKDALLAKLPRHGKMKWKLLAALMRLDRRVCLKVPSNKISPD